MRYLLFRGKLRFKLILEAKDSYYLLRCQPCIGDKAYELYRVYPTKAPFFFTLKRDPTVQYLFSNLQEAAVINYLKESGFAGSIRATLATCTRPADHG